MKKKEAVSQCPCHSGEKYSDCCQKYHLGERPENALALMRSRFSAYALCLPDYIIATTHPASPHYETDHKAWAQKLAHFSRSTHFEKLKVLNFQEFGAVATVSFTAHLFQHWQNTTFTERSTFEQFQGKWMYRNGVMVSGHAPNFITNSQSRLLPLAYYGDPILRKKGERVEEINSDLRRLVDEMVETMDAAYGMGLAAPQVHQSISLFVIRRPIETKDQVQLGEVKVFINPVLSEPSDETSKTDEGCLSIPTIREDVVRHQEITIEYTDLEGKRIKERCKGLEARMIQHEYDHVQGILFIDRIEESKKAEIAPILELLQKRIHQPLQM